MLMTEIILMLTTWPDEAKAEQMAKNWLDKNLVACVNILPKMRSIYKWDGETRTGTEHQMLLKTTAKQSEQLKQAILESHPYECPEILILPVTGGHDDYMNWITGNTK